MRKYRIPFENYEELALDISTVMELLLWMAHFCNKMHSEKIRKIYCMLEKLKVEIEEEMLLDYPDRANSDMFHGEGSYELDIRKHRNYIYSAFKGKEK